MNQLPEKPDPPPAKLPTPNPVKVEVKEPRKTGVISKVRFPKTVKAGVPLDAKIEQVAGGPGS